MLKTSSLLFTLCLLTFIACKKQERNPAEEKSPEVAAAVEHASLPSQKTFVYKDGDTNTEQQLVVNWISADTITFTLAETKDSCNLKEDGKAVNHYPGGDGESDEDENGDMYSASEYIFENVSSHLAIRISDEFDIAKVKYGTKEATACIFSSSLPMRVKPE